MNKTSELAAVYDAIYGGRDDIAFWRDMATAAGGRVLELGCGTGRVLIPVARTGVEITGLELAPHMLKRCRAKLEMEPFEVRERVVLVQGDMTSFDLGSGFALITIPFAGFQHLRTVEEQLACLERCHAHLLPEGRLALDMPNPAPAPPSCAGEAPKAEGEAGAEAVEWTGGRRLRWWGSIAEYDDLLQCGEYEVTYEIIEPEGRIRRIGERFPLRYVFRYELEHPLVRAGFRPAALDGDHDGPPLAKGSPALIVVAERAGAFRRADR